MEFSAQQIAGLVEGTVEGNPEVKVNDFAKIEEGRPGCISFLANDKYEHYIYTTESSIVLVNDTFQPREELKTTLIRVPDARQAVATLIRMYDSMRPRLKGIDSTAYVDPSATIGKDVYLGPFVAIGPKAVIGDGCVLHPHATVGAGASIGNGTEMYSNSVV
ncbi:MAG: UDP-3-O-(3-hydroxymyristoyl)glucosamine N-acyltransferase, partial [Bacteroidaceae bacterium]|nr:UDP-3-O-(3-hydroxymyristoyl)glucosamine N-acyltransferase [Bacteroidaceae bacterium]